MLLEVGLAQPAAVGAHEGVDLVDNLTAIKTVASLRRDELVGVGQRRVPENLTLGRRVPLLRQGFGGQAAGIHAISLEERSGQMLAAQDRHVALPVEGDELAERKSLLGITDRGGEHLRQRQPAELRMKLGPAVDRARHADGQQAVGRDRGAVELCELGLHLLVAESERRAAGGVEAVEFFRLRIPDDGEQVAADAAAHRLHQAQRGVGRDGGVDRRAAGLENIEAGLRRERLAGADHAVLRDDFRAGGERSAGDAVHLSHGNGDGQKREYVEEDKTHGVHVRTLCTTRPGSTYPSSGKPPGGHLPSDRNA